MRNIKEFQRSTPSYTYNVTDASWVNLDDFAIGMSVRLGAYTAYVVPKLTNESIFDIVESATVGKFENNAYSLHVEGTNSFTVTFPLWRIPESVTETEGTYQIFLFRIKPYSGLGTTSEGLMAAETISPNNIVLDYGGFTLLESLVPPLKGQAKRGSTVVFV